MNGENNLDRITARQKGEEARKSKMVSQPIYFPVLQFHVSTGSRQQLTTSAAITPQLRLNYAEPVASGVVSPNTLQLIYVLDNHSPAISFLKPHLLIN